MSAASIAEIVRRYGTLVQRGADDPRSAMRAETEYNNIVEELKHVDKELADYAELRKSFNILTDSNRQLEQEYDQLMSDNESWRQAVVKANALVKDLREVEKAAQAAFTNLKAVVDG